MDETLEGRTTRPVIFIDKSQRGPVCGGTRLPAGTRVYVTCRKAGEFRIRVPGTLLEQDVRLGTVEPA